MTAKGWLKKLTAAIGIELDRARGHAVGEVALRLHVARKLDARVLQFLHVDREASDRAGRQRHVDDPHHAALAPNRRRLHLR